jgi:hypothetical protein
MIISVKSGDILQNPWTHGWNPWRIIEVISVDLVGDVVAKPKNDLDGRFTPHRFTKEEIEHFEPVE